MQHGADANAGADVGGASGQIAEVVREGVLEPLLQNRVDLVDGLPRGAKLEAGPQRLHAQMVFLVDHDAERSLFVEHQPAANAFGRVLPADEVALDQDLLIHLAQVVHGLGKGAGHLRQALHCGADRFQRFDSLRLFCPTREGHSLEIARQADAARHHDTVMRPFAFAGLGGGRQVIVDVFHGSNQASGCRIFRGSD